MMRKSTALAAALLLTLGASVFADPGQEPEDEGKAVQRIARAFTKLKSYAMDCQVEGGQAEGADHRITTSTVNTTYTAVVNGTVCRVDAPKQAFRPRLGEGGAIQNGVRWGAMLSTDEGRLMERLFDRPEALLAECVRLKRAARWVLPEGGQPEPAAPSVDAGDEGPQPDGTRERDDDDDGQASRVRIVSNHIRIEGPPTVALDRFIRIQNSGCFSAG
jgi:hypothetical protein